jgi:hypothetical protein
MLFAIYQWASSLIPSFVVNAIERGPLVRFCPSDPPKKQGGFTSPTANSGSRDATQVQQLRTWHFHLVRKPRHMFRT